MKKIAFLSAILITLLFSPTELFAANTVSPQSPINGGSVTNNTTGGWTPYMNWADSSPGNAFIYYVEMSTKSQTNSLGYFYDSDRVGNNTLNSPITDWNVANDFIPFYLLPGTYYWHVLRWDNYANSSWSSMWSFTVPSITQTGNAKLGAMPSSFTFVANQGDTSWTDAQTLTTLNIGGSPYGQMYVATNANNSWIGLALGAGAGEVLVGADPTGLSGGTHSGSLTLKGVKSDGVTAYPYVTDLTIPVTFKINRPPVLGSIGSKSVNEGSQLLIDLNATDQDGDSIIYSATNLPSGAIINPGTGVFSWVPSANQSGIYTVTFKAGDETSNDTEAVTITVNNDATPPTTTITTVPASPDGTNGWYKTAPTINLSKSESGTISYSWNTTTSYNRFFGLSKGVGLPLQFQGTNTLYYYSTDLVANQEAVKSKTFKIDTDIECPCYFNEPITDNRV